MLWNIIGVATNLVSVAAYYFRKTRKRIINELFSSDQSRICVYMLKMFQCIFGHYQCRPRHNGAILAALTDRVAVTATAVADDAGAPPAGRTTVG